MQESPEMPTRPGQEKGPIKAKLFTNGRSQAVRIPKEIAFTGIDAVHVEKRGNAVVLTPIRKTWGSFSCLDPAGDDFMVIRPRLVKS